MVLLLSPLQSKLTNTALFSLSPFNFFHSQLISFSKLVTIRQFICFPIMSNSTSRFSLSKNNGSNQSDPHNNNNNRQEKSESIKQDSRVNFYELTLPRSVSGDNLHSLLYSLTPLVAINFSSKPKIEGSSTESEEKPYFVLEDLWESYNEWCAFGVEVPFKLNDHETVTQYFVPSLSGLQLYVEDDQGLKKSSEEIGFEPSKKTTTKFVYQFFEEERPHERMLLNAQVSNIAEEHPYIKTYRSCDISPCSWFSVAWYPIYGIPAGSTLKNIKASFLTFHNLSTHFKSKNQPKLHDGDGLLKMPLPIFGLTTNKLKRSILSLPKAGESTQLNSLLKAADDWLKSLNVVSHYDQNHFVRHGKQWVEEKKDKLALSSGS